jgi:hypothetical protein
MITKRPMEIKMNAPVTWKYVSYFLKLVIIVADKKPIKG